MRRATASVMEVAAMVLMILTVGLEAAPTHRGLVKASHPPHAPAMPALNQSQLLKNWLLSTKAAAAEGTRITDGTTTGTLTAGLRTERQATDSGTGSPDKRGQILQMISALEELHRMFNSTLSSRITILPRANGRNSGRKNKAPSAADGGGVKPTTIVPAAVDSTASRASADVIVPSLTGRNFRKSLPPQNKKTNKRVCFWKYCSQN